MKRAGEREIVYRDDDPSILIFGDTEAGIMAACETALSHGARVAAALPIADAADRLDSQIAVDLVIIDVSVDHGPLLDRLFHQIEDGAVHSRFTCIVSIAPELVDLTAANILHGDVSVMVGRDREALSQAIAMRLARTRPQLQEDGAEPEPLGEGEEGGCGRAPPARREITPDFTDVPPSAMTWADGLRDFDPAVIRGIIRARRLRSEFFGVGMFADPAWDILLDLMIAKVEKRSVAVSSLCIAAAVPATTALRWIKQLTEMGLLRRVADPQDGRRVFIELTEQAIDKLIAYFNALIRGRGA